MQNQNRDKDWEEIPRQSKDLLSSQKLRMSNEEQQVINC